MSKFVGYLIVLSLFTISALKSQDEEGKKEGPRQPKKVKDKAPKVGDEAPDFKLKILDVKENDVEKEECDKDEDDCCKNKENGEDSCGDEKDDDGKCETAAAKGKENFVKLSDFRDKKDVVLIFGSYT
ncbi:MAG: hypothetical protein HY606_12280 [Planctomycetes bacterium]|nr:hypothetical protein [Planctomycetota bacterium]